MKSPVFEKKNVLVTGGAGFLGSHLCERLLREANVICIDDLSLSSIHNIEHLLPHPYFEFIRHDINEPIRLEDIPELEKFRIEFQGIQEIYHLACPTSSGRYEEFRTQSLETNSIGVQMTLKLAVAERAKYLLASSSVVYGATSKDQNRFAEEDEGTVRHLSPHACYDEGKRFAETCVDTYRNVYGLDAKIARIFPTYGPRMRLRDGLFIADFIIDALDGKPLVVYGNEQSETTLCYISDIIDGLIRLMRTGPDGFVVNLGTDETFPVEAVAKKIIAMTGSSSQIEFQTPMTQLSSRAVPDLRRAKDTLGWLPLVRLEDGLHQTINYTIARKSVGVE